MRPHWRSITLGLALSGCLMQAQDAPLADSSPEAAVTRSAARASGALPGTVLDKPAPVYPAAARAARVQGTVMLQIHVGADGLVKHVEVTGGPAELRKAAIDAVAQWRYQPKLAGDKPVDFETTVPVKFALGDAVADPNPPVAVLTDYDAPLPPGTVRISGAVIAGLLVTKVNPTYPPDAKAKGISGAVVLSALIGADGAVERLKVVSGPEDLRDSAVEAVRQRVYRPYQLNGKAVPVLTTITVNYTLGG